MPVFISYLKQRNQLINILADAKDHPLDRATLGGRNKVQCDLDKLENESYKTMMTNRRKKMQHDLFREQKSAP